MESLIISVLVGVVVCVLGIIHMTGNVSSLHSYHRHRVTEENKKPFGRLVGAGTLIIGVSLIAYGVLLYLAEQMQQKVLITVGTVQMIVCLVVGLGISFYAMKKYNGGIF